MYWPSLSWSIREVREIERLSWKRVQAKVNVGKRQSIRGLRIDKFLVHFTEGT